jgi:phage-related protein
MDKINTLIEKINNFSPTLISMVSAVQYNVVPLITKVDSINSTIYNLQTSVDRLNQEVQYKIGPIFGSINNIQATFNSLSKFLLDLDLDKLRVTIEGLSTEIGAFTVTNDAIKGIFKEMEENLKKLEEVANDPVLQRTIDDLRNIDEKFNL